MTPGKDSNLWGRLPERLFNTIALFNAASGPIPTPIRAAVLPLLPRKGHEKDYFFIIGISVKGCNNSPYLYGHLECIPNQLVELGDRTTDHMPAIVAVGTDKFRDARYRLDVGETVHRVKVNVTRQLARNAEAVDMHIAGAGISNEFAHLAGNIVAVGQTGAGHATDCKEAAGSYLFAIIGKLLNRIEDVPNQRRLLSNNVNQFLAEALVFLLAHHGLNIQFEEVGEIAAVLLDELAVGFHILVKVKFALQLALLMRHHHRERAGVKQDFLTGLGAGIKVKCFLHAFRGCLAQIIEGHEDIFEFVFTECFLGHGRVKLSDIKTGIILHR